MNKATTKPKRARDGVGSWEFVRARLVERKSLDELERAAANAKRRSFYTQEDLDLAGRRAEKLRELFADEP